MSSREEIEQRITEAFSGFQNGKSREAMIQLLANDIEEYGKKKYDEGWKHCFKDQCPE